MAIKFTAEREKVLDDWGIKYAVDMTSDNWYFSFKSANDEAKAIQVLKGALEL